MILHAVRLLSRQPALHWLNDLLHNKGYVQLAKMVLFVFGAIIIVATLIDRSPLLLLSGLGAMSAVILLVYKDTLLSFVASVQLTSNDMLRVGDWIEM
uniref:Mechanosensitive ion channel protein n=1 Tax=Steinernema glaseri TaxID=37863 RepID=A0A1I7YQK6_9BILA